MVGTAEGTSPQSRRSPLSLGSMLVIVALIAMATLIAVFPIGEGWGSKMEIAAREQK